MKIVRNPQEMRQGVMKLRKQGCSIGLVPTMGALHEGHLRLIQQARERNDKVVVSIFVNPLQFGRNEDFSRYPGDLKKDVSFCRKAGVDYVFVPSTQALYPNDFKTSVNVEGLSDVLCGFYRSGHFKGVATIVAKLFNIIPADTAYFGQKDAQQVLIVQRMVRDLNFPVEIRTVPTVREPDGLAMSSRNAYLSATQRKDAAVLSQSLRRAQGLVKQGVHDAGRIKSTVEEMISAVACGGIEYVAVVNPENLQPVTIIKTKALLAIAVRIGKTRLIDNVILNTR